MADGASSRDRTPLDEVLMTITIELLYFLEHTPERELDPSAAERMEREIAYQLSRVDPQALQPFVDFIRAQAQTSARPAERAFLESLPTYLGWTDG